MIRCYNSMRIGFKHRGLHAVRSWTLAVMFVGCDCDVMFEKKNEVILSSPKFISQISILLHALPPPAKNQEGRKPINIKKNKKVQKTLQIPWTNHMFFVQYFHHASNVCCLPWFMLVSCFIWVRGNTLITLLLVSCFRRVRGNTLITLLLVSWVQKGER